MFGVTDPFDKVREMVVAATGVEDTFDFVFDVVIDRDRERRRDRIRVVRV